MKKSYLLIGFLAIGFLVFGLFNLFDAGKFAKVDVTDSQGDVSCGVFMAMSPVSLTLQAGQSGSVVVTYTSSCQKNTDTITLTISSEVPCSVSPSNLTIAPGASATNTVTCSPTSSQLDDYGNAKTHAVRIVSDSQQRRLAGQEFTTNSTIFNVTVNPDPNASAPAQPKLCADGETCPRGSWCEGRSQKCFYTDKQVTCVPFSPNANGYTLCTAGTGHCDPNYSGCVNVGQTVTYDTTKWCGAGLAYYKDNQMTCSISGLPSPDYSSCRPGENNCISLSHYGPSSAWCGSGALTCYERTNDGNSSNDRYCAASGESCPITHTPCDSYSSNCKSTGDSWTVNNTGYYCQNSQMCTNPNGGGSCVANGTTCPIYQTTPTTGGTQPTSTGGTQPGAPLTTQPGTTTTTQPGGTTTTTQPGTTTIQPGIAPSTQPYPIYIPPASPSTSGTQPVSPPPAPTGYQYPPSTSTITPGVQGTTTPPQPVSTTPYYPSSPGYCENGKICDAGSWCQNGKSCYYPDGKLTCIGWDYSTTGTNTQCSAGTSPCSPTDKSCVPSNLEVDYASNKWCAEGMPYYSVDGKKMLCVDWDQEPPVNYTTCKPGDSNCVPAGGYGLASGWCSNGKSCYQIKSDFNLGDDLFCAKYPVMKSSAAGVPMDPVSCPDGYSPCSPTDSNCKTVGQTWKENLPGVWCMDGQKCSLAEGGGICVKWNESCPAGTKYCDVDSEKFGCLEPNKERIFADFSTYPYCGGGNGMIFYQKQSGKSYKAICIPQDQNMWMNKDAIPKVPDGDWQLCRPGEEGRCIEPGEKGPGDGWCAWMPPMSNYYAYPDSTKTRQCPAFGEKVETTPGDDETYKLMPVPPIDSCIKVVTSAKNLKTGECARFPTPCDIPKGWVETICEPKAPDEEDKGFYLDPICIDAKIFLKDAKKAVDEIKAKSDNKQKSGMADSAARLGEIRSSMVEILNKFSLQLANGQCDQPELTQSFNDLQEEAKKLFSFEKQTHTNDYLLKGLEEAELSLNNLAEEIQDYPEDDLVTKNYQRAVDLLAEARSAYDAGEFFVTSDLLERINDLIDRNYRLIGLDSRLSNLESVESRLNDLVTRVFEESLKSKLDSLVAKFEISANQLVSMVEKKLDGVIEAMARIEDKVTREMVQVADHLTLVNETYQTAMIGEQESRIKLVAELNDFEQTLKDADAGDEYIGVFNDLKDLNASVADIGLLPDTSKAITSCIREVQNMIENQTAIAEVKAAFSDCEEQKDSLLEVEYDQQYRVGVIPWTDTRLSRWDFASWNWAKEFGVFRGTEMINEEGEIVPSGLVEAGRNANTAEAEMMICRLYGYDPDTEISEEYVSTVPGLRDVSWVQSCNSWLASRGADLAGILDVRKEIGREEFAELLVTAGNGLIPVPKTVDSVAHFPDVLKLTEEQQKIIAAVFDSEIMTGLGQGHERYGEFGVGVGVDRAAAATILMRATQGLGLEPPRL